MSACDPLRTSVSHLTALHSFGSNAWFPPSNKWRSPQSLRSRLNGGRRATLREFVMEARIDEIGAGVYRLSIFVAEIAPPAGFTFNHFLFTGDEPLLFHCEKRTMFSSVSAAVARIMPVERLRWLGFGHFAADECGSMNERLAFAPAAHLTHGLVSCHVSVRDIAVPA